MSPSGEVPVWSRAAELLLASPSTAQVAHSLDVSAVASVPEVAVALLARGALTSPFVRAVRDAAPGEPTSLEETEFVAGTACRLVHQARVLEAYEGGATIVFQGLERWDVTCADAAAEARRLSGHPCDLNLYVTPPRSQGLGAHYDPQHVLVIQLEGSKSWLVRSPDRPIGPDDYIDRVDLGHLSREPCEITLLPGSLLWLPAGWLHQARAGAEPSVHLTLGVTIFAPGSRRCRDRVPPPFWRSAG